MKKEEAKILMEEAWVDREGWRRVRVLGIDLSF